MDIALAGSTSKKAIVYPLLKLFMQLGDACFITHDTTYKRLIDGNYLGEFQNITIVISDDTSDEIFRELGHSIEDFNNILYDVNDYVPDMLTSTYMCTSTCYTDQEISFSELVETPVTFIGFKYKGVNLKGQDIPTQSKSGLFGKKPDVIHKEKVVPLKIIPINIESVCYSEIVETDGIFPPVRDPAILDFISSEFTEKLKMTKQEIKKLLQKEWK